LPEQGAGAAAVGAPSASSAVRRLPVDMIRLAEWPELGIPAIPSVNVGSGVDD